MNASNHESVRVAGWRQVHGNRCSDLSRNLDVTQMVILQSSRSCQHLVLSVLPSRCFAVTNPEQTLRYAFYRSFVSRNLLFAREGLYVTLLAAGKAPRAFGRAERFSSCEAPGRRNATTPSASSAGRFFLREDALDHFGFDEYGCHGVEYVDEYEQCAESPFDVEAHYDHGDERGD